MRSLLPLPRNRRWSAAGVAGVGVLALAVAGSMGFTGTTTDGSVSSTSTIRSAHTAARGAMIATNMPIITATRMSVK